MHRCKLFYNNLDCVEKELWGNKEFRRKIEDSNGRVKFSKNPNPITWEIIIKIVNGK